MQLIPHVQLGDTNFNVFETDTIVDIGNRVQRRQVIAVAKGVEEVDINTDNFHDITPDYTTLLIKSFDNAITTNLILLGRKIKQ